MRLALIGQFAEEHLGYHLAAAARDMGFETRCLHAAKAYEGPALQRKANWWLRGRRPNRLTAFGEEVAQCCREFRPDIVLATGLAPIPASVVREMSALGAVTIDYLTDDPWNSAHQGAWFFEALPLYHHVCSPRRANMADLRRAGCLSVQYVPFGYAPEMHHAEEVSAEDRAALQSDIIFAGGADGDRIPYIVALKQAGFHVGLYGGLWERHAETRDLNRGKASPALLRKAILSAKTALCLVRRANRDGHCMRTFEVPAVGAAMVMENTEEHRELFGPEGHAAVYFDSMPEMNEKVRWLLDNESERVRLSDAAHRIVTGGKNSYRDRLEQMLALANVNLVRS